MKKKSIKLLKRKSDVLWSQIIKRVGYCEICGGTNSLNAHHIISRSHYALRYDIDNGICLCAGCHRFNKNSAHNNPVYFMDWFKTKHPERYEYLLSMKNATRQEDYEQILKRLEGI